MTIRTDMTLGPSAGLAIRMLFVATAVAACGVPALAQQPKAAPATPAPAPQSRPVERTSEQCAAAYHQALEPSRRDRAPALGDLMRRLRAADADLPGKWLFANPLFQKKPTRQPRPERVCVEMREVRGVERCVRFDIKPLPPPPPDVTTKAAPGAEDLRLMRAVADIVEARGAIPDVSANGRQTFLVQRLAQDLRNYVIQPATPVLCAGAPELLEFYGGQMVPVRKRLDDLQALAVKLKETAAARTRDIAVTELRVYDAAMASAKAAEEQRARAAAPQPTTESVPTPATAAAAAPPALPPKPAAPAALADYAVTSFTAQIAEALRPLLPAALIAEITAEPNLVGLLARAQKALLDPEVKPPTPPAPDVRDMAIAALRLHEARVYADRYAARYGEIDVALVAALKDIKSAHGGACTCKD